MNMLKYDNLQGCFIYMATLLQETSYNGHIDGSRNGHGPSQWALLNFMIEYSHVFAEYALPVISPMQTCKLSDYWTMNPSRPSEQVHGKCPNIPATFVIRSQTPVLAIKAKLIQHICMVIGEVPKLPDPSMSHLPAVRI